MPTLIFAAALVVPSLGLRPLQNVEHAHDADQHVRMDPGQSVVMLNRHTFNATVKQEHVDNWIVLFCVDWLEHCQGLWHDYRRLAHHWEQVLAPQASSWQNAAVRFAEVDCATDKALCNENSVENYPSAVHFQGGKFASAWEISRADTSLSGSLSKWIKKVFVAKSPSDAEAKATRIYRKQGGHLGAANLGAHLHELQQLLSWKDPTTAAIGYCVLAVVVALLAWIVGTALELELKTVFSCGKKQAERKQWPQALLPSLPEMPAPRTIVRNSMTL